MASSQAIPEPMNSSPHHSKVKVAITLADPRFVAGAHVSGKLEMECRADKGLGIGIMMVELFALQELTSRDHSASSTFLHSRRLFQGPGLPPSNAVQAHPLPGDPHLPQHYYQARRGQSTFLFRIPIPASSPSSISFGSGLAKVRYELRASVGVHWKGEKRLIIDKHPIEVVASYPYEETYLGKVPEGIVVGENGKLWMQGKVVGGVIVAGGSACLELQVKNHSNKKNSGLTLTLTRTLYLPGSAVAQQRLTPVQISDTLTTVPFRGPEYIIPPGAEGVANLVFDVPKHARGVRGGTLDGEEAAGGVGPRHTESLFEIKCKVEVKLTMGMGSKDILLEIPVEVVHPSALPPSQPQPGPYAQAYPTPEAMPNPTHYNPFYPAHPTSPPPLQMPYVDPTQNQVWLPPPIPAPQAYPYDPYQTPMPPPLLPYAVQQQPYYHTPSPPQNLLSPIEYIPRPSSAGPVVSASQVPPPMISGMPALLPPPLLLPLQELNHQSPTGEHFVPEEGKGELASRVAQHLRLSSRNRSVSPQSHRYPITLLSGLPESSATAGVSQPRRIARNLPPPPGLSRVENISLSPPNENGVVHSPRPQLTPKHSFTRDPVLGATSRSERVEELEKMADAVGKKSQDLSCDLPKGLSTILQPGLSKEEESKVPMKPLLEAQDEAEANAIVNKTLPGPPVPSGKNVIAPVPLPTRPRADLYFSGQVDDIGTSIPEPSPMVFDRTPSTPPLLAVLPPRPLLRPTDKSSNPKLELKTESGLDALERRLLAEVGTRKLDPWHGANGESSSKQKRPDIRSVMSPIDTSAASAAAFGVGSVSIPIQMPVKSPEPLHDSAISSLTLAGGLGGDDSDGEFDGRTHRAGSRSRSRSSRSGGGSSRRSVEREGLSTGLHLHMRQRAEVGTPTRASNREREGGRTREEKDNVGQRMAGSKEKEKTKEGKTSGKKKSDRLNNKTAAKGRVAAWLGCIDPDVPPQEQIIPPSPSVLRSHLDNDQDDEVFPAADIAGLPTTIGLDMEPSKDVSAPPNPRSSGFVPIATLKRNTLQPRPLITRDATVVEEARRIQDIWSSQTPPAVQRTPPQFPLAIAPTAPPVSIRTDRRVSSPSSKPNKPHMPISYSAAARNVWKLPDTIKAQDPPPPPPNKAPVTAPPTKPPGVGRVKAAFPPPKPINTEVKYDIRSARGGRGGKVTSVANLWSSGAITNPDMKGKGVQRPENHLGESKTPVPPSKPLATEKKLFSAAVMTPAPPRKPMPVASSSNVGAARPADAQKRPDSRVAFSVSKSTGPSPFSVPRKVPSATALSTAPQRSVGKTTPSTEALMQKRPATSMSNPYSLHGKTTPTLSTPASDGPKPHALAANRGVKPVIKGTSDPAVVSSSHAVPHLSSTASLARPPGQQQHISAVQKRFNQPPRPVKLPNLLSTSQPSLSSVSGTPSDTPRPVSPSKPAELAFGQARLRDLIKKYQAHGQKT